MFTFNVIVENEVGHEMNNIFVKAPDENTALINLLQAKTIDLCAGDTIKIEMI